MIIFYNIDNVNFCRIVISHKFHFETMVIVYIISLHFYISLYIDLPINYTDTKPIPMFYLYKGADPVKEKPTVVQIANRSGVSIATVSRVLNGKGTVSPGTRQRVLQAARDLEYDSSAAMPISPSRKLLALLPGFENPFYAPIIQGIQHTAHAAGFELLLMPIGDNGASASSLASLIRKEDYKGIIWLCSAPGPDVLDAVDTICPSVMIGEYPEDYTGSYVSIDDRSAGYRAVNHLISIGCRRIGMLNCAYRYKYARHRKDGYQRALTEAGLPVEPKLYASIPAIDYTLAYSAAMQKRRQTGFVL